MFPSQLTWSREMLKSAATERKRVITWRYQEAITNILLLDIGPNHAHDIAEIIFKKIYRCQSIYLEKENKLKNLYSLKPQDQQIDVCIIDTWQLAYQSPSAPGSPSLQWRCLMKACLLPLPAGICKGSSKVNDTLGTLGPSWNHSGTILNIDHCHVIAKNFFPHYHDCVV